MTPTITPRCVGSFVMDASGLVAGADGDVETPSTVFLIEAAQTILVDTGFGPLELMADRHPEYDCRRRPGQRLEAALDDEGYAPADVDAVVLSHLDWDHCDNLAPFDGMTDIYVQRAEVAYAVAPYPMHEDRYDATPDGEPPWLSVDLTPLDGETDLCAGVTAFPTPGHTPGHQSVAVETDAGTTVVAVDAVPTFENVSDGEPSAMGLAMDDVAWWQSARAVCERADRILPGHEWEILEAEPMGRE
jgi:glyoxylase-like metal-dependent hydrolase (beta-lactamase superfamily II)